MLKKGLGSRIRFRNDNEKVILFVHGFRDNPQIFDQLNNILFDKGFSIYNLRLPGHAIQNENDILKIKLRDWEIMIENVYLDLADQFNHVYLCGFSIGASLMINLAKKYSKIAKIALISPMFKIKHKRSYFSVFFKYFIKKLKVNKVDCSIKHKMFENFTSFIPMPQSHEIIKLLTKTRKKLSLIQSDVLAFLSRKDRGIIFSYHEKLIKRKTNFQLVVLENSYHYSLLDNDQNFVIDKIADWFA